MQLSQSTLERLNRVDTASLGRYITTGYLHPSIQPIQPSCRVAGPAYPVRVPGRDASALYRALLKAPKGAVVVVDRGHDAIHAAVDYEIALMAQHREIAGIVVDGTATNRIRLQELGFPVFCRGYSPAACVAQGISGEIDVPVDCGGVIVNPGDLIIGDADGVVVLPPEECEARLRKAEAEMSRIARRDERIAGEGYRFLSCEDVDMEAFVRADVLSFIDGIKKKCRYD